MSLGLSSFENFIGRKDGLIVLKDVTLNETKITYIDE